MQRHGCSPFWSSGRDAVSLPFGEVGPAHVFEAASGGEQGVGARFRPAAARLFAPAADDALAGIVHDAGSDCQSALRVEVVVHSRRRRHRSSGHGPRRLRTGDGAASESGDDLGDSSGAQLLLDPVHSRLPFALVQSYGLHCGGRVFEGMMKQVEDEGTVASGQDFPTGQRKT